MDQLLLGELEWDGQYDWWEGWVRLPFFASFDFTVGDDGDGEDEDPELFELHVPVGGEGAERPPSLAQQRTYSDLVDRQGLIGQAVIDALFGLYQRYADDWREGVETHSPGDAERIVPHLESADGLRRLVRLRSVELHEASRDGYTPTEFTFACAWDDEHGLAVVMHRDIVLGVGGDGTGYYDPDEWADTGDAEGPA